MKFGAFIPYYPLEACNLAATFAEKTQLDSLWMADHLVPNPPSRPEALDPWLTLAVIATQTKRLKLGTAVTDPHRRHPASLAQTATTLDIVSNGRLILGIGAGEAMNLNPFGVAWDRPVTRLKEAVEVIKKLWTEENVNYNGVYFKLDRATLLPKPIQKPHPPIWIAANSPRTRELVGRLADGWLDFDLSPEMYREDLEDIRNWAKKTERSPEAIEPAYFSLMAVSNDGEAARKAIELPAKIFLAAFPRNLERLGFKNPTGYSNVLDKFVVTPEFMEQLMEVVKEVPFEAVEKCFIFGTPDECIGKLERYVKVGARHFLMATIGPDARSAFYIYATKIVPYLKETYA
ncbi:MAG: LLM class flavin-dependent oxidoreductase [Candidatus Bathyarchaeia archaeon]